MLDSGMGGIMDYKARFYSPYINHFLQPDSIIPNPANPQSFNRYSYVVNRPLVYTDPTGHTYMCGEACEANLGRPQYTLNDMAAMYGVSFSGNWSVTNKAKTLLGVYKIGKAIQEQVNSARDAAYESCIENMAGPTSTCSPASHITSAQAFKMSYGTGIQKLNFQWEDSVCEINRSTCFADAYNYPNTIRVWAGYWATDANGNPIVARTPITSQLIVHELGHAFNVRTGGTFVNYVAIYDNGSLLARPDGFARGYSFGQDLSASEISADMFVGWVYGQWADDELGSNRDAVMTTNISSWITDSQFHR